MGEDLLRDWMIARCASGLELLHDAIADGLCGWRMMWSCYAPTLSNEPVSSAGWDCAAIVTRFARARRAQKRRTDRVIMRESVLRVLWPMTKTSPSPASRVKDSPGCP